MIPIRDLALELGLDRGYVARIVKAEGLVPVRRRGPAGRWLSCVTQAEADRIVQRRRAETLQPAAE